MIPKILHLCWNDEPLSYLQYLTPVSFHRHHPDWKIKIHCPSKKNTTITWKSEEQQHKFTGEDYNSRLWALPYIEKIIYNIDIDANDIIKSDIRRLELLSTEGGIYVDMDVLFIGSIPNTLLETNAIVYYNKEMSYFLVGFLASKENFYFYKWLYNSAYKNLDSRKYESVGSSMFGGLLKNEQFIKEHDGTIMVPPMSTVYPFIHTNIWRFFYTSKMDGYIKDDTFAIHWYNGASLVKEYLNEEHLYLKRDSIVNKFTKDYR